MQLGMVGLGRMGANMTRRLMRGGHTMVVSDLSVDAVKGIAGEGAVASSSLDDLVSRLTAPRAAWIVQRPSPESCTNPLYSASVGFSVKAIAVRSSNHELTTLPRRQTSAISGRLRS